MSGHPISARRRKPRPFPTLLDFCIWGMVAGLVIAITTGGQ